MLSMLNCLFLYKPTGFRSSSKQEVLTSVLIEAGRISIIREQVFILSGDDASERVERQRKSFVHVLAQPRVVLLAQIVFGPRRLLDAVSRVQAWGHLDAAKIHIGDPPFHISSGSIFLTQTHHNVKVLHRGVFILAYVGL